MKRIFIAIICVFALIVVCFGLTACVGYTTQKRYDDADKYLVGSQTYEVTELVRLKVDWTVGTVTLVEDDTTTCVTVIEENALSDEKKVHSYYHDGILDIHFWQSGLRGVVSEREKHLTITYPSVCDLRVEMTSGDVVADKLTAENVSIKMTSGDIDIKKLQSVSFACQMTSGDLAIDEMESKEITFEMTSGKGKFGSVKAETVTMSQTSGDIVVREMETKSFSSDSTSGDLDVAFTRVGRASITMTSGDTEIQLPESGATASIAMTSGSFKTDLPYVVDMGKYVFGDGECELGIKMTSGTLRIK